MIKKTIRVNPTLLCHNINHHKYNIKHHHKFIPIDMYTYINLYNINNNIFIRK